MIPGKNIYLYFIKEFSEPDTWDNKFAYFFNLMVSQVLGTSVKIHSNSDVTGVRMVKPSDIDITQFGAIVVVQNNLNQLNGEITETDDWGNLLSDFPKSSIFQVIKKGKSSHIDTGSFTTYPQYKFFQINHRNFQLTQFDPDVSGESENGFWEKLSDLVYDIKSNSLQGIESLRRESTIYLAEVSDDQQKNREKIKRELLLLGYKVLPLSPLPRKQDDFENAVTAQLFECMLSVNILGEMYGESPQMSDYSYVELQNRIFEKEYATQKKLPIDPKLTRIIWTQPKLEFFEDKQSQYFKRLQNSNMAIHNTEFVQSTITELIEIIQKKIKQIKSESFEFIEEEQESTYFVIYDKLEPELKKQLQIKLDKEKMVYQIHGLDEPGFKDVRHLISRFKFQHNFLLINSERSTSWVNSLLAIIARSKGLSGAIPLSSMVVLSKESGHDFTQFVPVKVKEIQFMPYRFEEQIDSIITKITV